MGDQKFVFRIIIEEYTSRGQDGWGIWFGSSHEANLEPNFFILDLNEAQEYINLQWITVESIRKTFTKDGGQNT